MTTKQEIINRMMMMFDGSQDPDVAHVRATLRRVPASALRECYIERRHGCGGISPFTGRCRRHYMARIYTAFIAATLFPQYFDARALDTITGRNAERNRARIELAIERGERFEDIIERLGALAVA